MKKIVKSLIGKNNSARLRKKIKRFKNRKNAIKIIFGKKGSQSLAEIATFYGTDKVDRVHTFNGQTYMDIYEKYLSPIRNEEISFLEIGVKEGYSLNTWQKYFSKAQVRGIDIDPRCKNFETKNIKIEVGSQADIDFLENSFKNIKNFDVILDDGAHVNHMILKSFEYLFYNRLASGGIYIIEDLGCSYSKLDTDHNVRSNWSGMQYNQEVNLDNSRQDMDDFFMKLIYDLDHLKGEIMSIHFYSRICIIIKI